MTFVIATGWLFGLMSMVITGRVSVKVLLFVYMYPKVMLFFRGAWRTAPAGTTSSTGRESVPPQTLGIIHLDASHSASQQAGRCSKT